MSAVLMGSKELNEFTGELHEEDEELGVLVVKGI